MKSILGKIVVVAVMVTLHASFSEAITWRVEKDGSGDFDVIQDAVDAAAEGDTILVGAGRFETMRPIPYWEDHNATIAVEKGGLVIIGAGPEHTIVGTGEIIGNYNVVVGGNDPEVVYSLTLMGFSIEGGYCGIEYEAARLKIEGCVLRNSHFGILVAGPGDHFGICNHEVIDSEFFGLDTGIVSGLGVEGFLVANCQFDSVQTGISFRATYNAVVSNCKVIGAIQGYQYDISSGAMTNCEVTGVENAEYGVGAYFTNSTVSMNDCIIDFSMANTFTALSVVSSDLSGSSNIIKGGGLSAMRVFSNSIIEGFTGNEIYKANTFALVAQSFNSTMQGPFIHFDLTSNYWGTDNPDSIAAWIDDANDHPYNPNYWAVVDFEPFEPDPVPVQKKSLGGLKDLFR